MNKSCNKINHYFLINPTCIKLERNKIEYLLGKIDSRSNINLTAQQHKIKFNIQCQDVNRDMRE
jgi:hypothetical protein